MSERDRTWRRLWAAFAGGLLSAAVAALVGGRRRAPADGPHESETAVDKMDGNIPAAPILSIVAGWLMFTFVALGILAVLYYKIGRPEVLPSVQGFPSPRLVAHPDSEYWRLVGPQKRTLGRYGWVDRKAGIAHIPIARAMAADLKRPDPYAPLGGGGGR